MKIVSSDANRLEAVDKAYAQLLSGVVIAVIGLGMAGFGVVGRQNVVALVGLAVLVVGVLTLIFRKERTLIIDKGTSQLTFKLKSLVKKGNYDYAVSDVVKVEFTSSYQTTSTANNSTQGRSGIGFGANGVGMGDSSTQTTQHTQLHLVLKNGETIDIADGQRSMSSINVFGSVPNLAVGQQIATFIGVPFEQSGVASLGQAVSAVREAITGQTDAPAVVAKDE